MTALSGFKLLQNGYAVILIGQLQNRSAAAQFCRSLNSDSVVLYGMELNNMTVGPKTPCF